MSSEPWSVLRKDWNSLSKELIEGNWFRVSFNLAAQDLVKPERGIYVITMRVPKDNVNNFFNKIQNPIYIGESTNLKIRFRQHTSGREPMLWRKLSELGKFAHFIIVVSHAILRRG